VLVKKANMVLNKNIINILELNVSMLLYLEVITSKGESSHVRIAYQLTINKWDY